MTTSNDWVLAAPFRAHVRQLCEAEGMTPREVAAAAGVSLRTLRTLMVGRDGRMRPRLSPDDAARLFALTPGRVRAAPRAIVPPDEAQDHVAALCAAGMTPQEVASASGIDAMLVEALHGRRSFGVPELALWRLRALAASLDEPGEARLAA